ncbi:MAG TPA: aldehyde dehydrogenase family protein [Actinomycetota bacterium]|nr:aldehyde dehydrogenase family protein [Actinomycetota bacterium]
MDVKPFYVAGEWRAGTEGFEVRSPFDGDVVARVGKPGIEDIEDASAAAARARSEIARLPLHVRAEALTHVSKRLGERADEIAASIASEGGKPIKWAKVEAARAVSTFRWAAEECRRETGEIMRFDADAALGSRAGLIRRVPLGPVLGITPFNFPVNLVAHKLAPAIAVGAPVVIKPATRTPLGALVLAELVAETELPPEMLSVLPIEGAAAGELAKDDRFAKVSFTGSSEVGWSLKAAAPKKTVTLELGGNAGVVIHDDADLDHAAERVAFGGFYQAGQSCIAVQRVFVQRDVAAAFTEKLQRAVGELVVGDPMDEATDVGPLIDSGALDRVSAWVDEAVAAGAELIAGGKRRDPLYEPTVLARTTETMKVRCEEIFGPVVTLVEYDAFEDALAAVNSSRYGLQAGVFTSDVERVFEAWRTLEVGGVIVNDVSAFRGDQMPYGGSKDSGEGREGLRWAMEGMTETRILVLSDVPL